MTSSGNSIVGFSITNLVSSSCYSHEKVITFEAHNCWLQKTQADLATTIRTFLMFSMSRICRELSMSFEIHLRFLLITFDSNQKQHKKGMDQFSK